MVRLTPTKRIEEIEKNTPEIGEQARRVLECYEEFLSNTDAAEEELLARFLDPDHVTTLAPGAARFGDAVFEFLETLGRGSRFYRLLVV